MSSDEKESSTKLCLVFDTETTGLIVEGTIPYLCQLSYIVYNITEKEVDKIFDKYVAFQNEGYTEEHFLKLINNDSKNTILKANYDRLTDAIKNDKAMSLEEIVNNFYYDVERVIKSGGDIVAHNIEFDRDIMNESKKRVKNQSGITLSNEYCTQENGINICKIPKIIPIKKVITEEDGDGIITWEDYYKKLTLEERKHYNVVEVEGKYKNPKNIEVYSHYFGYKDDKINCRVGEDKLHDSIYDVAITLRSYLIMKHKIDLCKYMDDKKKNEKTKQLYNYLKEINDSFIYYSYNRATKTRIENSCSNLINNCFRGEGEKAGGKRRKSRKQSTKTGGKRRKPRKTKKHRKKKSL